MKNKNAHLLSNFGFSPLIRSIVQIFCILAALFSTTAKSFSDWRSDIGVFRVGVVLSAQLQGFPDRAEPFRLALSEILEIDVEFFPARSAQSLVEALVADRIEYAILPATAYALTWQICECVEPIAIAKSFDGTDGYHTVLVSGPTGPATIEEVGSQPIAVLSEDTISQKLLFERQIPQATNLLSQASADQTLSAFLRGEYPMLLGWSSMNGDASLGYSRGTLHQLQQMGVENLQEYKVIWKSEQIPHSSHVVRSKLAAEPKNIIRNFLTNLVERNPVAYDSIEPHHSGGLNVARHSRYKVLIDLVEKISASQSADTETLQETD